MTTKEYVKTIQNVSNEDLIKDLENCGHDGYYNDLYYPVIKEIKRRLKYYKKEVINSLPAAQPEKEIPKRVLWTGWKGYRDTRYKCPNCKKPVKNDDVYCHRCGQKLMFPRVDWTPYVEGQKQELIVRWDDE